MAMGELGTGTLGCQRQALLPGPLMESKQPLNSPALGAIWTKNANTHKFICTQDTAGMV